MNSNLSKRIHTIFPALLFILLIYTAAAPEEIRAFAANPAVLESANQEDFDRKFREGRDLIDREEWSRAAEKFSEIATKYPDNNQADAALYWLAFCQKKQKQFKQADATLARLIERFPASSWASDARVMKLEIAAPLGNVYVAGATGSASQVFSTAPNGLYASEVAKIPSGSGGVSTVTAPAAAQTMSEAFGGVYATAAKTPLDREDEIKLAAFQSLLVADPKRAVEAMSDVLQPNSKASETLKIEMVRVVRRPRVFYSGSFNSFEPLTIVGFSGTGAAATANTSTASAPTAANAEKNQTTALIREALVRGFQTETNVKVRKEIVSALAGLGDTQSSEYVLRLYDSANDREIKKAIINSLGYSNSYFYTTGGQNIFHNAWNSDNSKNALSRKAELDKLMEIARTETDDELRRLAFSALQRQPTWSTSAQSVEMIARMYDAERDEKFKISLIQSLGRINQKAATDKLLQIARSDQADKLKLEAIYALRSSKDPEVLRFLENLIK